jgi:hypothetical protein
MMQLLRSKKAKVIPRLLWRRAHRDYFSPKNQFTEDMLVWCERFRVVETIAGAEGCERIESTRDSCCSTIARTRSHSCPVLRTFSDADRIRYKRAPRWAGRRSKTCREGNRGRRYEGPSRVRRISPHRRPVFCSTWGLWHEDCHCGRTFLFRPDFCGGAHGLA